jgi:hypothetical protein
VVVVLLVLVLLVLTSGLFLTEPRMRRHQL